MKTSIGTHASAAVAPVSTEALESPLVETWYQDPDERDLWHGPHGVIVNTSALERRRAFYTIVQKRA